MISKQGRTLPDSWHLFWIELNWSCDMEHAHGGDVFRITRRRVVLRTQWRTELSWECNWEEKRTLNITSFEEALSWELWTYFVYGLICVCCSCNFFSLLIYVLQKLQRAELFSILSRFPKTLNLCRQSWGKWAMFSEQHLHKKNTTPIWPHP